MAKKLLDERPRGSQDFGQPGICNGFRQFWGNNPRAHGDDLGIIRQRGAL
jgi:hypothetical protein